MNEDILITHPPTLNITCPFCKEKMNGSYEAGTKLLYSCFNHNPLLINYYYQNSFKPYIVPQWATESIIISYLNYFRLLWNCELPSANFYLQEYEKAVPGQRSGGWFGYKSTSFSIEWIFSQTPERILSILQMYKTFS